MSLIKAEHINDYKLFLTFSDGSSKVIDFEEKLKSHAIYKPYLNLKKFLTYKVDHGALRWPGIFWIIIITS